jgi:phosphate-selective porin
MQLTCNKEKGLLCHKRYTKNNLIKMKKLLTVLIFAVSSIYGFSQTQKIDSLKDVIDNHEGKLNALDDRVLVNESDLAKLNKIKISGYIQAQWEHYGADLEKTNGYNNTFYIRRARIKFTYEPADGVKFVLQPDFSTGNLVLKDAYTVVNIPKLKNVTLWMGQMNRPNYDVEYSSSSRELLERARVTLAIYPGEREIGAKVEYNGIKVPLLFQVMMMNGNFTGTQAKDVDSRKDVMARFVYSVKLPDAGLGIDFGANHYFGNNLAKTNKYVKNSNGTIDSLNNVWRYLDKHWTGGEIRVYADVLGGMSIKAEYVAGINSVASTIAGTSTMTQMKASPNLYNNFAGYYITLVKNVGAKNQAVVRYDYYDPNTKLSGDAAGGSIFYKTWSLAWQYYLNDNIRLTAQYTLPKNEINAANPKDMKDNLFTIRVQAKF